MRSHNYKVDEIDLSCAKGLRFITYFMKVNSNVELYIHEKGLN